MKKKCLFITRDRDGKLRAIPVNDYEEVDKDLLRRTIEPDPTIPAMFVTSDELDAMHHSLSTQTPTIT